MVYSAVSVTVFWQMCHPFTEPDYVVGGSCRVCHELTWLPALCCMLHYAYCENAVCEPAPVQKMYSYRSEATDRHTAESRPGPV